MKTFIAVTAVLFVACAAYAQTPAMDGTKNTPQDAASKTRASVAKSSLNPPQTGGAKQQEAIPAKK